MAWQHTIRSWWGAAEGSTAAPSSTTAPLKYPQTFDAWNAWYARLQRAYEGAPYTTAEVDAWRLFLGVDNAGEVIAETRRLTRDIQHVVDTDARAIAGSAWTLEDPTWEAPEGAEGEAAESPLLEAGEAVWERSGVQVEKGRWARVACALGDIVLEAVRTSAMQPHETTIAQYHPAWCRVEKDQLTGTRIERLIVEYTAFEAAVVAESGVVTDTGLTTRYTRVVDAQEVKAYRNGKLIPEESGPHGAGTTPVAHLICTPFVDPEHGLWAAHGLEGCLATVDSMLTQIQAIGARHGNPLLALTGARFEADGAEFGLGKKIGGIPTGGSLQYVEASLQGVATLLEAAQRAREQARETLSEFLFTDSGANSSGDALSWRATAFASKAEEIRGRWFDQLARLTGIAVAMDAGRPYDPERDRLRIVGSPILPVNAAKEAATLQAIRDAGGLTNADYIAGLQRLGYVSNDHTPTEYAQAIADERHADAQRVADREAAAVRAALEAGGNVDVQTPDAMTEGGAAPMTMLAVGDRVRILVDHMPGMTGKLGTIRIVRSGKPPYYGVAIDGEAGVHKWLAQDEVEPASDAANPDAME